MKKFSKNIHVAVLVVALLWAVFFLDVVIPWDLRAFGLQPRNIEGIAGIFFSPFLHGNIPHLAANSGALFILLLVSLSFSRWLTFWALFVIIVVGGALVWSFGQSRTVHIGASGIVFGLIGFLMFIGFFRKEPITLIVSIIIFLLYGGALFSLLVPTPGISWSGHFFGFFSGILAAWLTRNSRRL
jgi:membrane associated rhomboid family serine protease